MGKGSTASDTAITRKHRNLLLAAALMTYLLVTLGGIVCVTDSSQGCPDWPGCYGKIVPPLRSDAIIETAHRLLAALTLVAIVAVASLGWFRTRSIRWVSWPPLIAVGFLLVASALGAVVVLRGLSPEMAAVDLGSALMVLALMLTAAVMATGLHRDPALPVQPSFRSPFARQTLWALVATFVVLVSGVLVAEPGSTERCLGWPLYFGQPMATGLQGWLQVARRLIGGVASVLIIAVAIQAWRTGEQTAIVGAATAAGVLLLAEMGIGAYLATYGFDVWLQVAYVVVAATLWAVLMVLVVVAGLAPAALFQEPLARGQTSEGIDHPPEE
jgi:heme A synthase